jgi:chemotaxis protein histidine kinase CheA
MSSSVVASVESQPKRLGAATPVSEESMVVRLGQLDKMLELAGEVIIVSSNINAISRQLTVGATVSKVSHDDIRDLAITSSRISSDLHCLVSNVRTVDMSNLFVRFRRLVRDTSRRLGKAVRFEVSGDEICIDKKLSEKIYDPIAHLIRNAIAHGLEDEQTRTRQGKAPVGTLSIRVFNHENATVIEVTDNGGGLNHAAIRDKIEQNGLASAQRVTALTDEQLYDYLFMPGFSTAASTSAIAGRGVGLDVVRNVIDQIDGDVRVKSTPGMGTTFSLVLPKVTAVNISDALLVRANDFYFAFSISSVVASLSISPGAVSTVTDRGRSILYLDRLLPLFDLMEVFGEDPVLYDDQLSIIIVEYKHKSAAFVVSDFLSPQKIVISDFDEGLQAPGLVGTAILSGRQMALVVDLPCLFARTFGFDHLSNSATASDPYDASGSSLEAEAADVTVQDNDREATLEDPVLTNMEAELTRPTLHDSEFLLEVESMLGDFNRELLALDENRDKDNAHAVFRLAHSIKGNLTMYGAEEPAAMTHQLETILARIRHQDQDMNDEIFGVLFDGSAYLEDTVAALLRQELVPATPERLLSGLAAFAAPQVPGAPQDPIDLDSTDVALDALGQFHLSSRRRAGTVLRQCRIDFSGGDQPDYLLAYLILDRIQRVADVLGSLPALSDIESGLCEGSIKVLISAQDLGPEVLDPLEKNLKRYYGVKRFVIAPYA